MNHKAGQYIHEGHQRWGFLYLIRALVVRDLRARYRRSILGVSWAILQPLTLMVLFSILRGIVSLPSDDDVPYVIFTYVALVPWTFFSNAVIKATPSVSTNAELVKKMAISREIFPAVAVLTALFDLLMASLVLIGMMIWFGFSPSIQILWLPLLVCMVAVLAWGIGLGMAALATFKNDFIFVTPFLMQFWLFLTPVMYTSQSVPDTWQTVYHLNPMVGIIEAFRDILLQAQAPDIASLGQSALVIICLCLITLPFFRSLSQYFADVL